MLGANAPLRLEGPGAAWLVVSGRVQVFAVERSRKPLFAVDAGGLLLAPPADGALDLLAVGIDEGTAVRELDDPGELVDGWLDALAGCVRAEPPGDARPLDVVTELAAGDVGWARGELMWLSPGSELRLFDEPPAGADVLPVPARAWARAESETVVRRVGRPSGSSGVDACQRALLAAIAAELESEGEASAARIERRDAHNRILRSEAYTGLAGVLEGRRPPRASEDEAGLIGAFQAVGETMGVRIEPPQSLDTSEDPADAVARASGVRVRRVSLGPDWWRQNGGPLIGTRVKGGQAVALLQPHAGAYDLLENGSRVRVDAGVAATLEPLAIAVYRPLPEGPVSGKAVRRFILRPLRPDLLRLLAFGVAVGLLSLIPPLVAETIFSRVVPGREHGNLLWLAALLGAFAFASFGFVVAQQIAVLRLEGRTTTDLQAAMWDRLLDLPLPFFRRFSAGGLTMRVLGIAQIRQLATAAVATAALALPVGVANLALAFAIQPRLALFGLFVVAGAAAATVLLGRYQARRYRVVQSETQELFATSMQLVEGISKLRVADAEERGFARWATRFASLKRSFYEAQLGFVGITSLTGSVTAVAMVFVLLGAATLENGAISGASFIAFNTAFIQALVAVTTFATISTFVAQAIPLYEAARPILDEPRETQEVRADPGELRGEIEVNNVNLRYAPDSPLVLEGLSFGIEAGEFVAIVGPSGAGKSSLLRVLLGFELPEVGSVRYDGEDLRALDPRAVRRQIGVVLQTARLLPGDLYRNIVGAWPLTMEDAWEAAEIAGIADEIRALPMGMKTHVSEGAATFSGGQRQRLLIARGVAGRPRILLFDEATSALDNRTQTQVAEAISRLRATRIVIAHRLSTVRNADRILVLEGGQLVQEGSFDELLEVDGPFSRLAQRQLV